MKRSKPDYARMSDPDHNPQWRRRWTEPAIKTLPPLRNRIVAWRADRDATLRR